MRLDSVGQMNTVNYYDGIKSEAQKQDFEEYQEQRELHQEQLSTERTQSTESDPEVLRLAAELSGLGNVLNISA